MFSTYTLFEIISIYLIGSFINYQFYFHINLIDSMTYLFQFKLEFILFSLVWCFLNYIIYYIANLLFLKELEKKYIFLTILFTLFTFSFPKGILNEKYNIYSIIKDDNKTFEQALDNLGVNPKEYVTISRLKAKKGKNIIVLSLESLEQGYLKGEFNNLTPNLNKLAATYNFYNNFYVSNGGGWTAASVYSMLTGVPAFFKGHGNDIFQGSQNTKIVSLGHVLKKAGYSLKYIIGKPEFAGMYEMLHINGFDVISEKNCIGKYPESNVGLNDLDIFSEAKLQINKSVEENKPFAVFLSTINTHFPRGIKDNRLENKLPHRETQLEYVVSCTDYIIGDFIKYITKKGLLNNTVFYILPDHPLMGSGSIVEKLKKTGRALYLITNADEKKIFKNHNERIYQIELPKIIYQGAGIKTNAKFLTDFIQNKNVDTFINKNIKNFSILNKTVKKEIVNTDIIVNYNKDKTKLILTYNNNSVIENKVLINKDNYFIYTFTEDFVFLRKSNPNKKVLSLYLRNQINKKRKYIYLLINLKNDRLNVYLGDFEKIGLIKDSKTNEVVFAEKEIKKLSTSIKKKESFDNIKLDKKCKQKNIDNINKIVSSTFEYSKIKRSVFDINGKKYYMKRGLNLLIKSKDSFVFENYDVYSSKKAAKDFLNRLDILIKNNAYFFIASHDAISNKFPDYKKKLKKLGFKLLQNLNGRYAYLCIYKKNNKMIEYYDEKNITYYINNNYNSKINKNEINNKRKLMRSSKKVSKDVKRFIAHAGGKIDGKAYTDSLEALNYSYKKGFRMFELDIIKTSDNVFVAAHDWKHWKNITNNQNFEGIPTREEFKKHKIYGKYTPMDINDINKWFREHKDAILVTDKVNLPKEFSEKFIAKNRLFMELFSWKAVNEALECNILGPMPTGSLVMNLKGDKLKFLKKMRIEYVAISRFVIEKNRKLLQKMKESGIKFYAFGLNFKNSKDEKYVIENELDCFYGIYADVWEF